MGYAVSETKWYDPGTGQFIVVDGHIVERDALRIAEAIAEYDPNLYLLCLDPARAEGITEEPFVVAEKTKDGTLKPVLRAWKLDDEILLRLYNADTQKKDVLANLLKMEEQQKLDAQTRYQEKRDEAKDILQHLAGMKSRFSVRDSNTGELLTFYDDRPPTRK